MMQQSGSNDRPAVPTGQPLSDPSPKDLSDSRSLKWTAFPQKLGLWVAESDYGLAPAVEKVLQGAVSSGLTGYLPGWATHDMGKAAAGFMSRHYGWQIAAENIKPVSDVLAALEFTIRHLTRPGSAVVVPTPAYMPFLTLPKLLGREIIEVPLVRNQQGVWVHDLDGIADALRAGAGLVLLCNPHNPLGRVFEKEELEGLAGLVAQYDARIFADEIHAGIRFDEKPHIPFASISDTAAQVSVTATSTSKAFNTPGLKCGQIILTADSDQRVWRTKGWLAEHGAGTLGVLAAAAAYSDGDAWLRNFNATLAKNRELVADLLHTQLPEAQFTAPEGTYLAWINLKPYRGFDATSPDGATNAADAQIPSDANSWATYLRDEAKIAVTDGAACGDVGAGHIRINFATSQEVLRAGIGRLSSVIASR